MEEILEVVMQPKKKKHKCNGYYMIQNEFNKIPNWCNGTIKHDQKYISINIKDDNGTFVFHDCERCHEYIKTHKFDLIEA